MTPNTALMERLFTPHTLADHLGLAVQTIYNRHAAGGDLPPVLKLGRVLRFQPEDVAEWLARQSGNASIEPSTPLNTTPRRRGRPTKAEEVAKRKGLDH